MLQVATLDSDGQIVRIDPRQIVRVAVPEQPNRRLIQVLVALMDGRVYALDLAPDLVDALNRLVEPSAQHSIASA